MEFTTLEELTRELSQVATRDASGKLEVREEGRLRAELLDRLTWTAVFAGDETLRNEARQTIHGLADTMGAIPSSIQNLYKAMGRNEVTGFTVPAVNIRGMTYDVARAMVRTAMKLDAGAFIFEIARSEIGYTEQRPAEYAAVVLAACLKEGYKGPVFIQGDHFQANAKRFAKDPQTEIQGLKDLISEALAARFYNIDIDTSTLVDLSHATVTEQQRLNFGRGAELTAFIRQQQPSDVMVSVGGEIGEVGGKNSTPEEFKAYMDGLNEDLAKLGASGGISKISVQTGTSHGGVPLPDGTVAEVAIDFGVLETISGLARKDYGLGGCVQHGASTLPEEAFDRFPPTDTCEIHLATGFQNIIYEHEAFPAELRNAVYDHLRQACAEERKPDQTEEQFLYKTRKKGFGPFKREVWSLDESVRSAIAGSLEQKFEILFSKLAIQGTTKVVAGSLRGA